MINPTGREDVLVPKDDSPSFKDKDDVIWFELQLTDALIRTSLIVKNNVVLLRLEYYDTLNFKLLCINVTNSIQLKALITTKHPMLCNINGIGFAIKTQSIILSSIDDASSRLPNTYINPFWEVFSLTTIDQKLS